MGGLLYKDFVSVCRIKKINLLWIVSAMTFLFGLLRMMFPGNTTVLMGPNETGELVSFADTAFLFLLAFFVINGMSFINGCTGQIIDDDEKNKIRDYLTVMPLRKETYIASKYIFIGIACYVFLSITYLWGIVFMAYCEPGDMFDFGQVLVSAIPTFAYAVLLCACIELPLFILLGKDKAAYIKVAILLSFSFVVIGYLLFGNLSWIGEVDIVSITGWINKHQTEVIVFQSIFPVIVLGLYYLSYRITCGLAIRRGR